MNNSDLIVTIRCLAYNHASYIRQCLDGFIMQKTNFRFEAIVHDDASTDGTADIIREYAAKYPDIIKPIFQTENQYSKRDGSIRKIMNAHTHGKYIAICEGDDYWIDPYKLQKQIEFLERNWNYSMCFTNAEVKCEGNVPKYYTKLYYHLINKEYTGKEILSKWSIPTASICYRNFKDMRPFDDRFIYGDIILFLWLSKKGNIYCLNEKTVVYRKNNGGISSIKIDYKKQINHYIAINEHFGYDYDLIVKKQICNIYIGAFLSGHFKNRSEERRVGKEC